MPESTDRLYIVAVVVRRLASGVTTAATSKPEHLSAIGPAKAEAPGYLTQRE